MSHAPDRSTGRALRLLALAWLAAQAPGAPAAAWTPSSQARPHAPAPVTFSRDVAPILVENCASCHRPAGPAPFSVLSYESVRTRAARIAEAAADRSMPPWLPAPGYREFEEARRLEDAEIEVLRRWVASGAPEGDPHDLPVLPAAPEWPLGKPDLVLEAPPYTVPAEGRDVYRNLVVRVPGERVRFVRAVDLRPGAPNVVHHARLMVDTTHSSRRRDADDAIVGFDGMDVTGRARNPPGHFVGWTPGRVPHGGYEGLAWPMVPGSDMVLQLHLRPTGRQEVVRARIGIYLTDEPPARQAGLVSLGSEIIDIPPGATRYEVADSFTLPVPVTLLSVYPHAHYLARTMAGDARLPDGSVEPLIRIEDWDFDWQDEYRLAEPLRLPAGTVLTMRYTYDNSAGNSQNPNDPAVRVRYGSLSTDEMADLIVQVALDDRADQQTLDDALARKYERAAMAYAAWKEHTLGLEAAARGERDRALRHYQASLRARDDPRVLLSMVDLVLAGGDAGAAVLIGERAARMTAYGDIDVLDGLGRAYAASGRRREAVEVLEKALALAREGGREGWVADLSARLERLGGASRHRRMR